MKNKFSKWDAGGGSRSIVQGLNLFTSRNLFKSLKSILMVVALLSLSSNVWADYTVTFNTAGSDGANVSTKVSDYVNSSSTSYVSSITTSKAYYNGKSGVKLGASSSAGNITLNLSTTGQITASSISIVSAAYDSGKTFKCTVTYTDNTSINQTFSFGASSTSISLTSSKTVKSVKFESITSSKGRGYISSFTIAAAASKKTVYLKNTMNWPSAYAYYYTGAYWDSNNGSGSASGGSFKAGGEELTYDNETGLFKVETSNTGCTYVVFTKDKQDSYTNFYNTEAIYCNNNFQYDKVVVVASQTNETKNGTKYYSDPYLAAPQYLDVAVGEGTGFFLPGEFNSWETKGNEMTLVDGTLTYTKDLTANTTYEFKVYNKGKYYGWGTSGSYHTFTASGSKDVYNGDNNLKIQTSIAGTYTFTFNSSNNTVTVTYPAPPVTVTFKNNGAQTSTQQVPSGGKVSSLPTLAASQAPISGYTFIGWVNHNDAWSGFEAEMTQALITGNEVINANVTYDAVWAKAYDDYGRVIEGENLTTGKYLFTSNGDYALDNNFTTGTTAGKSITDEDGWVYDITDATILWVITAKDGTYSFYNAAKGKYLNTVSGNADLTLQDSPAWFTLTRTKDSYNNSLFDFACNGRHLEYYSSKFDTDASRMYGTIMLYKQDVSNYFVTPPAQITVTWHIGNGTQTATTYDGTAFSDVDAPEVDDNAIGDCVNKFMGWATAEITKDEATADDVAWADETAISNSNKDFYAVFANAEGSGDDTPVTIWSENFGNAGTTSAAEVSSYEGFSGKTAGLSYSASGIKVSKSNSNTCTLSGSSGLSNLYVSQSGQSGSFTVSGLNTEGYENMVLAFNLKFGGGSNQSISVAANGTSLTIDGSNPSGTSWQSVSYSSGIPSASSLTLVFTEGSNGNSYIDDISLIGTGSTTYSNYATSCPELKYATIHFDANGKTLASGSMPEDITNAIVGRASTLPECEATVTGYTFAGWSATSTGEVITEYTPTTEGETYTMYAKWTAKTVTITWNANGGSVTPTSSPYTYDGATVELPTPTTTLEKKFVGWFTEATGGTQITEIGTTNKPAANVTYFAQWRDIVWTDYLTDCGEPDTWKIWYKVKDAADNTAQLIDITETGSHTFTSLPKETTYEFKIVKYVGGEESAAIWYTNENGGTDIGTMTETNHANWSFDVKGGTGNNTRFLTAASGDYTMTVVTTGASPSVSITYPASYQITFVGNDNDGGSMTNVIHIAAGEGVTLDANAYTKTGYHFKGWVANVDVKIGGETKIAGTLIADGATIQNINRDIILTAQWETRVTALTISQESDINEIVAGETLQLTLTVTPNGAEYGTDYTWHSSNTSTMTVSQSGVVTGVQANTGDYIYVRNNDGVESNHYVINVKSAACDTWGLHMWNESEHTYRDFCFSQVGSTTEWRTQQVTLPSHSDDEKLKVLYAGMDGYYSAQWITRMVPTVGYIQGGCDDASNGNRYAGQDVKGYFRIFSDSKDPNYYLAFQPVYAVMYGVGEQPWQQVEFTDTETANNFYTGIITVPEGYNSNVEIYAGTSKASGVHFISGRSKTVMMNTITGLTSSGMAGKAGKFKINDNYCNESNFNLSFIRYYRLHYNLDGGAGTGDYTDKFALPTAGDAERTFALETAPTKEGYTFRGWSVSIGGGAATIKEVGDDVKLTEDAVATAIWAENFTVTYDLDGYSTSCSSSTTHYCGEEVTVCPAPEDKTGYTFMGWNTDDITGSPADYQPGATFTMPCSNVVFTAHYEADSYTITYEGLEGASNTNPANYTIESNITFVNPGTRTGYTFTGWTENGTPITGITAGTTGNKTITANWSLNSHNVTFNANGHGAAPTGYTGISYGALITEPTAPADVEEDENIYSFIGWYKEAGCTNAWNFATDVMPDNDLTLYAKWSGVTYEDYRTHCCTPLPAPTGGVANNIHMTTATLSWDEVTGNNGYQVSADQASWTNVLSGESYNLTDLTAGTPYIYYVRAIGDNNEYCQYGTTAQIEFTTKAALHITYNANGGTGADVVSEVIEEGTSATVAGNTFTAPTGMTFNGWNTQAIGEGTAYDEGDVINPLNADLTLYAQWIGAEFNVTYDLAEGTGGCTSTKARYNSPFTICSTIPTKGTNAFTGWSSDVEIGGKSTFQPGETFTMPASNVTLTAQWTASYTVTYVINNVVVSGPNPAGNVYVAQGQSTTLPDFEFSCGLYNQFIGWVDAEVAEQDEKIACPDLVGKAGDSFTPTGDITLYALFGHDAENLGWVKQTTISSGKYIMSDGTRVMTGFNSESTSINFLSAASAADDGNGQYATKPNDAAELEVNVLGDGKFTMMLLSNNQYLAATNDVFLNPSSTATNACKWELMDGSTQPTTDLGPMPQGSIHSVEYTSRGLLGNTTQVRFTCYDKISGKSVPYLYKLINEGYYTTSPTCAIPTSVTVTYNKNTEGEVEMCEDAELHFTTYPYLTESYTLCAAADVVHEGYVLRTWNTAANGSGKNYAPGTVFAELGNNLNLYAQWDRVYTVTLHDNGATTTKTQASEGAAIDLGSGKDAGDCDLDNDGTADFTWSFVGWTTNNMTLVEYPVCPEVVANPTEYVPVANVDLYAVYSRPIENTKDFAVGVSGAYIVKDNSKNWYLGAKTNGSVFTFNAQTDQANAIVIKLIENNGSYNVATDAGFVEWDNSTSMRYEQQMNGHWTISGSAGNWSMRESVDNRYLCWNQSEKFNLQQSNRAVDLIPTTGTYYFSNPVCQDKFDITFEVRGGEINYGEALEEDYTGLASGKQVTEFPTIDMRADLMDWTFVGWTTVDYNTQHALDDENASTEAPTSTIYRTDGVNTFTMPSTNVTLYPVFTSAIKNEPMDLENGGDYYVYFTSDQPGYHDPYTDIDGQTIRVYAQNNGDNKAPAAFASTTSCANAQLFHFEQHDAEAGKWDIRLWNSAGDGYISNSYLTNPNEGNNDFASQAAQPDGYWTIEQLSDGSFKAQYSVNAGTKYFMKGLVSSPTTQASATFKCYSEDCDNSNQYYAVYLGSCVERTFSANPNPLSDLRIEGSVNVTSRTGVAVRATNFLTLKGIKLQAGQNVTISSDNADVYFSDTKNVNMSKEAKPTNPLQITVPESGSMDMPIYVHYKPTATVDGIESVTVTAGYNYNETDLTSDVKIRVRHLPEQVVIAAKIDNQWYALPANLNGATNPLVTPITVNEATMTAEAPTNCAYTLWPVKTTYGSNDRYQEVGERVRFSAANNGNNGLWASDAKDSHTTINNSAVIDRIAADAVANYEWVISTNDLQVYTLTATGTNNTSNLSVARPTSGGNQGQLVWGTYGVNVTAEVYLLPFTTFTDMQATVIEWFQDKVLVELADGAIWTAMSEASAQTQSRIGSADWATAATVDYTTYGTNMCTFNTGSLTSSYGENLSIKTVVDVTTYQTTLVVPIIIGANKSVTDAPFSKITPAKYNTMDVVVRDGATLTMNGASDEQTTFNTITIEPSSKVVVNSDRNLGASLITLRGGYDEIYSEGSYTMGYDEPQLYIGGTSSVTKINYEKRVNLDQMHGLTLPDTIEQNAITYLNGDTVKKGGNLYIDAYNGATRAANAPKNWYYYDATDNPLYRGVGYTISAEPAVEGQKYTILRMPMATGWTKGAPGSEDESKQIDVYAYGHGDANVRDNNKGWNCVGNPYMANYGYSGDDEETFGKDLFVDALVKEMVNDQWTGKWIKNNDGVRYVTIPHDDGHGFDQVRVKDAVLKPFRHFFVQIDAEGEDLKLTFSKSGHVSAPVRKAMDKNKEIELGILLSNGETSDNCGLLIGNAFSENYEMMNDLGKEIDKALAVYTITGDYKLAFNAMNQQYAEGMIPVGYLAPKAGNYTFSFDSKRYDIDEEVEHLYLLENGMIMADLLNTDYEFETTAGTTEGRFALRVVFGKEVTTDIEGAGQVDDKPIKFIYNDKMYILMRGKIYDATGKFVKTIEK